MRVLLSSAVLVWSGVAAAAPARAIHGVVIASDTGRPIEGATVLTERGDVAVTDLDGYFALSVAAAERAVSVVATGYESRNVRLDASDSLRIALVPASGSEVIEIADKAPEQTRPLSYRLTADEIQILPGAGNDVLRAAQILPGVARIPFGFGGLVLRGTSPSDTAIFLDGIEVPLAFHFGGFTSFFPTTMVSELAVTAGGFDAEYGRAQGGVVTLTTREPRTDRWRAGGSIGLLDSAAMAEGPVAGGGIIIGVRHSYIDLVADPFLEDDIPLPSYWDAQIKASFGEPQHHGRISPMLFLSIDRIANHPTGAPGHQSAISITSMFVRASVAYLRQWGPTTLHVVPWVGTNRLSFESIDDGEREDFERPEYPGGVRADLTRDLSWGHLRGGIDSASGYLSRTQVGFTGTNQGPMETNGSRTVAWTDLALWSEARIKLDGERFAVKPSVRIEAYGLTGEFVADPRLNIHQKLSDAITLRQALGRYHQPPAPGDIDPKDGNPNLDSSFVDQASLGLDAQLDNGLMTSITGFFDYGRDLGVQTPNGRPGDEPSPDLGGLDPTFDLLLQKQLGFPVHRDNLGRARSYGVEVLIKRHVGRFFGMLGYTLSRAKRIDDPAMAVGWRPFELDQRHNLNAAGSVLAGSWRLGARIQLVSGNPYTTTTIDGGVLTQHPWSATLPVFFQLDLRADRRWHRGWGDVNLYADIQNVTNRRNIEGRDYDAEANAEVDTPGLPIIPFVGLEFIPR